MAGDERGSQRPDVGRLRTELANAGYSLLVAGVVALALAFGFIARYGGRLSLALMAGDAAGLAFTLRLPGNPARAGYRFARLPRALSAHERALRERIARLRRPWLMAAATSPYFGGLAAAAARTHPSWGPADVGDLAIAAFWSLVSVAMVSWGVQYLQVRWSMGRPDRAHGPGP